MRLKKSACAVAALVTVLSLAACGGDNDNNTPAPTGASAPAAGAPASAPAGASAPAAVTQTQSFTAFRYLDGGLTGTQATLTFPPSSMTGTMAVGGASYATLTADAANDGVMSVSGTPNFGITLGNIPSATPVLLPGIVETCEAVAGGLGTPNPAIANALTKSTYVMVAGTPITDPTILGGRKFPVYYEDCLRDGSATPLTTHSSLTIDGSGNMSLFDGRTGVTTNTAAKVANGEVTPAGNHGDWLIPALYVINGQFRLAVIQHGTVAGGNTRDYVGVWLEQ
ncbi:hypothetical protein BGLT_06382 [Caballeronia glathei]|jgi:hypothetical protein|uniref:Lipoprotein n=1 Tax=Caballeronia glathei TaxID=60547 RepID=A0A069PUW0_9BURK|nr:hypothetical protein [Caballeronia glathei]KDR44340.1 hypothetical protein BG61_19185 [Caballeronia glathei]CDY77469.1 hypothetical protein BGLT_06382 [Caballeronia glathei]